MLGIENCERHWDKTEFCTLGKRAIIGSDKLKKQSIIYGSHCFENGKHNKNEVIDEFYQIDMNDMKLREELDVFMEEKESVSTERKATRRDHVKPIVDIFSSSVKVTRIFKAYLEDWEKESIHKKNCTCSEFKLLAKYRNMKWIWPEGNAYATVISDHSLVYSNLQATEILVLVGV